MTLLELLPFAVLALAIWLLFLRPARVRRDAQRALQEALAPGVRIMTTAGLFGTVRSIDQDRMELEVAPGIVLEMVPQAAGRIVPRDDLGAVAGAVPGETVPEDAADRSTGEAGGDAAQDAGEEVQPGPGQGPSGETAAGGAAQQGEADRG
jgi:preprotein translocase subunit YajC